MIPSQVGFVQQIAYLFRIQWMKLFETDTKS